MNTDRLQKALSFGVQLITAVFAAAILVVASFALVKAANEEGLVVESFSVPKSLEETGYTGQVFAAEIVDEFRAMQKASSRPAPTSSLSVVPPEIPLKVQVSEAGISLNEIYGFLLSWLSKARFVSGEIVDTHQGLIGIARLGNTNVTCKMGAKTLADIPGMNHAMAMCIYRVAEPYRFARYLETLNRRESARQIYGEIKENGPPVERAWSLFSLGDSIKTDDREFQYAIMGYRRAIAIIPNFALAYKALIETEEDIGLDDDARINNIVLLFILRHGHTPDIDKQTADQIRSQFQARFAYEIGDYPAAAALRQAAMNSASNEGAILEAWAGKADALVAEHDGQALLRLWHGIVELPNRPDLDFCGFVLAGFPQAADRKLVSGCAAPSSWRMRAWRAMTFLEIGDITAAGKEVNSTALDCVPCLVARGLLAEQKRDKKSATALLWRAHILAPWSPMVETNLLGYLSRTDSNAAATEAAMAADRFPKLADVQLFWGEALWKEGRVTEAIEKFDAAEKLSPNWARVHADEAVALKRKGLEPRSGAEARTAARLNIADRKASNAVRDLILEMKAEELMAGKDPKPAHTALLAAERAFPWSGHVHMMLAKNAEALGNRQESCSELKRARNIYGTEMYRNPNGQLDFRMKALIGWSPNGNANACSK